MPSHKLYYANARGRAEVARLIFAVAGVPYEDVRMTTEEWQEIKPKTPFGQMPALEVDGVMIAQSFTIYRFLARQCGLAGKTGMEAAQADMIGDTMVDLEPVMMQIYMTKDETRKAELQGTVKDETLPAVLDKLEKLLISNGGGDGFFVGSGLTWADLVFADRMDQIPRFSGIDVPWDKVPKLKALKERVEAVPQIADWIKKRPESDM